MNRPRIISTKKLQPAHRQFLLNANIALVEADFITITAIQPELKNINDNLIFTSQNAVNSILENQMGELKGKNCFCVGTKTKGLLEKYGFHVSASAEYAEQLGKIIIENHEKESFTFFSGNLRLDTLPGILKTGAVEFNEIEVYKTVLSPKKIGAKADGILFFSPSAVESFLIDNKITNEACFCIGQTTAKALNDKNVIIANRPTVENVIIQCINHYNKSFSPM